MNNNSAKMLKMIPGASGLRIECGLFLWLSSDVGNLLQVLDVPWWWWPWSVWSSNTSMVVVDMDERGSFWEWPLEVGRMKMGIRDVLTMSWGSSNCSSLPWNGLRTYINISDLHELEVEDDGLRSLLLHLQRGSSMERLTDDILQRWGGFLLLPSLPSHYKKYPLLWRIDFVTKGAKFIIISVLWWIYDENGSSYKSCHTWTSMTNLEICHRSG